MFDFDENKSKQYQMIFSVPFNTTLNRKTCIYDKKWFIFFQDQADAYSKELEIPNTPEKRKKTGKGAMLSF